MLRVLRRAGLWGATAVLVGSAGVGSGCHREGPWPGVSVDEFTYISRTWEPKTITVVDTRTNDTIWTVDIPVGQQLVVGFAQGTGPNEYTPDEIVWGMFPAGKRFGPRPNRMPCPPSYARRIDMKIRPVPEPVWSDVPGAANYRPQPRPIQSTGGRVVEPIEDSPVPYGSPSNTPSAPLPAPSPSIQPPNPTAPPPPVEPGPSPAPASQPASPASQPAPAQPAPEKKADPATLNDPGVKEVTPSSDEPKKEEPPIDLPD